MCQVVSGWNTVCQVGEEHCVPGSFVVEHGVPSSFGVEHGVPGRGGTLCAK
jgi:hypothetical protein